MKSMKLDHLEIQVNQLIHTIETLQLENTALRQKMALQIKERSRVHYKNERASKQVKQLIKQMKEELV